MPFDLQHVVEAAARAALDKSDSEAPSGKGTKRRGLSGTKAFLVGAGLLVGGRLLVTTRGRELLEMVQDRVAEYREELLDGSDEDEPDEAEYDDEDEPEAEYDDEDEPEAEYDDEDGDEEDDDEPEDEYDDEPEDEYDDEPEAEYDDDEDAEDYDSEDEDEPDEQDGSERPRAGSGSRSSRRR